MRPTAGCASVVRGKLGGVEVDDPHGDYDDYDDANDKMAYNGTMIPGAAPPSGFLFRPAHPASIPFGGFIGVSLHGRDSVGPVCAVTEAKCAQGDWCCDIGDTCSVDNGAFLCCPPGAACARVCAAGDFQCGSICCAAGQTCGGGDTPSPFCIDPTGSLTSSTAAITISSTSFASTTTPTTTPPPRSSTVRPAPTTPPSTTTPLDTTQTATVTSHPTRAPSSDTGLPMSAQIIMGVLVPVVVILIVIGLWFCLFRRPARRRREFDDDSATEYRRPPTPPPAYSKNEIVVATTSQGYSFSRARSPGGSLELETLGRPPPPPGGSLELETLGRPPPPPGLAVSTEGTARTSMMSDPSVSPTSTYHPGTSRLDV